jgi:hypothetical protein
MESSAFYPTVSVPSVTPNPIYATGGDLYSASMERLDEFGQPAPPTLQPNLGFWPVAPMPQSHQITGGFVPTGFDTDFHQQRPAIS